MNNLNLESFNISEISKILEDFDPDFNLPLIIGLSSGLGVLFLALLILTIYFSFFNNGGSIFLGSNFNIPGEFDDEENRLNDEAEYLPKFSELERQNYFDAKNFQDQNPPETNPIGSTLNEEEREYILDRGIQAYLFQQENVSQLSSSMPSVLIEDKLDVRFTANDPNSAILNYPLPMHDNDTIYFEVKLFEFPEGSHASIGVATKPYPGFRLPGYNKYSIAYESNGTVRINQPFYSPQIWNKLLEGDVLGVGFKPRSGTIFFTHNGKKLLEAVHNVRMDLFPIIGSQGPAKLNVNLGQLGFVFIEANVKKWGFGSVYGTIGIPPAYGKEIINDTVLDKGEELPPNYPSEEETFFGPSALLNSQSVSATADQPDVHPLSAAKPTKVISNPPSYIDEPKQELEEHDTPEVDSNVDEIRERLYERRSSTFDQQNNHYDPLALSSDPTPKPQETIDSANGKHDELQEEEHVKLVETKDTPKHIELSEQEPSTDVLVGRTQQGNNEEPHDDENEEGDDEQSPESSPDPETTLEATPEPDANAKTSTPPSSSKKNNNNKNKKKKKKSKKKGKK